MNTSTTPARSGNFLSVSYQIAPGVTTGDMLNDASCLLESAEALVNDAAINAEDAREQSGLFGMWQLIRIAKELLDTANSALIREKAHV